MRIQAEQNATNATKEGVEALDEWAGFPEGLLVEVRKLQQQRPALRAQQGHRIQKAISIRADALLHQQLARIRSRAVAGVHDRTGKLRAQDESLWCAPLPAADQRRIGDPVVGDVRLDGGEARGVEGEEVRR